MSKRPEYVRCVMHTSVDMANTSWCGQELYNFEIPFVNVDHALYTRMSDGRLLICPECMAEIQKVLNS